MATNSRWKAWALLLLPLALAGCQGAGSRGLLEGSAPEGSAALSTLLPSISDLGAGAQSPRHSSGLDIGAIVTVGSNWMSNQPHAQVGTDNQGGGVYGPTQIEGSGLSGLAYGIYNLDTPLPERVPELYLVWDDIPENSANLYMALANFNTKRWDWYSPQRESSHGVTRDKFVLPDWSRYSSSGGLVYVAVVIRGNDGAVLKRIRLGEPFIYDFTNEGAPTVDPSVATPGSSISYDFSNAIIPGAPVASWNLDYNGDAATDSTNPVGSQIYNEKGNFDFILTVVDDEGLEASAHIPVHIIDKVWHTETIEDSLDPNLSYDHPFCGVVDGRPAVAWTYTQNMGDFSLFGIEYSIASDFAASTWSAPVKLTQDDIAISEVVGLVDAGGAPGVFYLRGATELNFVRGNAPEASSFSAPDILSSDIVIQGGASGALIAGHPAVAYSETSQSTTSIQYRWNNKADGSGDWWGGSVQLDESQQRVRLKAGIQGPLVSFTSLNGMDVLVYSPYAAGADAQGITAGWGYFSANTGGAGINSDIAGGPEYYVASTGPSSVPHMVSYDGVSTIQQSGLPFVGEENINIFTGLLGAPMSWICYEQYNFVESPALNLVYFEPIVNPDQTLGGLLNGVTIDGGGDVGGNCHALANEGVPFASYEDRTNGAVKIAIMR